jgi:hypothetical protein
MLDIIEHAFQNARRTHARERNRPRCCADTLPAQVISAAASNVAKNERVKLQPPGASVPARAMGD